MGSFEESSDSELGFPILWEVLNTQQIQSKLTFCLLRVILNKAHMLQSGFSFYGRFCKVGIEDMKSWTNIQFRSFILFYGKSFRTHTFRSLIFTLWKVSKNTHISRSVFFILWDTLKNSNFEVALPSLLDTLKNRKSKLEFFT